ncbi:MAG: hypothetical protein KGL39_00755 [Patescibacteria group bacterium]|nr:hypothetical protein [Patescibacteria group bacterium]
MNFSTKAFLFNKDTGTYIAEASDLGLGAIPTVLSLKDHHTGETLKFRQDRVDTDAKGEDIYGWHYVGDDGRKILLIND